MAETGPEKKLTRIRVRRGLEENLPLLRSGEFGFSVDTKRAYIGTGVHNVELANQWELEELSRMIEISDEEPAEIRDGMLWVDRKNKQIKQRNGTKWEIIIDKAIRPGTTLSGGTF